MQRQGVTRSLTGRARYRFTSLVISTHACISLSQGVYRGGSLSRLVRLKAAVKLRSRYVLGAAKLASVLGYEGRIRELSYKNCLL